MKYFFKCIVFLLALSAFCQSVFANEKAVSRKILDLGADPTGKKDSWSAIQKAFDDGGTITIPAGSYLVSKTLTVTNSNTKIIGSSRSLLRFPKGFRDSGLVVKGEPFTLKNISIRDLTVECDKSNYTPGDDGRYACGITLYGVDGGRVENCSVSWFTFTGIYIAVSRNVRVSGCSTLGGRHGISANGHIGNPANKGKPYGCSYVTINNCRIRETWDTFIPVGLCADHITISGCQCEGSAAHGIDIFNSSFVTVKDNTVCNWMDRDVFHHPASQAVGVFIHSDWGVSLDIPTADITVAGNSLLYDKSHAGVRPVGINIAGGVDGVIVSSNTVSGGTTALAMTDIAGKTKRYAPHNVSIIDNVFKESKSSMWIESKIPMSAIISRNTFSPHSDGPIAHFGEKTQGVKFQNNTVTRGVLPKMPSGIQ